MVPSILRGSRADLGRVSSNARLSWLLLPLFAASCQSAPAESPEPHRPATPASGHFSVQLPGEGVALDMVPVPAGQVDGRPVDAFWMSSTEVPWDAFDLFIYGAEKDGVDAITRPSIPYISMDRGFGHEGWPVISLSAKGARAFCDWLSRLDGRTYRLPTEDEWRWAMSQQDPARVDELAWHAGNSGGKTHPVASKPANALGLHDLAGNAGEWCTTKDGRPVLLGGTYKDASEKVGLAGRRSPSPAWNASDPQIPKSTWWLADGGFTGLRVVCTN